MVRVKFIGFCIALAITCGVFAHSALAADKKEGTHVRNDIHGRNGGYGRPLGTDDQIH